MVAGVLLLHVVPQDRHYVLRRFRALHQVVRRGTAVPVHQQVFSIKVQPPVGGAVLGTVGNGDECPQGQIPAAHVPTVEAQVLRVRPSLFQILVDVRLIDPPIPLEKDLGGVCRRGTQLVCAVAIQVELGGVTVDPGQEDGISLGVEIVIVVEGGTCMFVQLAGVTDDQPIMAEQIGEGVHGDGVAAGIAVTQRVMLREGEEAAHIPCAHPVPARRLVINHGGVEIAVGGEIGADREFIAVLGVHDIASATLGAVIPVPNGLHGLRLIGCEVCQRNGQHRLPLRVHGRDGGPLTGLVGDKPVGAVGLFFQCHALPAVNMERVVVVEPDGIAHPLPGSDVDAREVVGIPVAVIVGIILREVLEVVHPDPPRLLQREAGVLQQHLVDGLHGHLVHRADQLPCGVKAAHLPQLLIGHRRVDPRAAIEQLKEVDVLRLLVQGVQKLVADAVSTLLIEELLIKIRQLVAGEGADTAGFPIRLGPGEGDGADARCQRQNQKQSRCPGLLSLGDAGDPVLQLPLICRHGGGGQQGRAGTRPHRNQGQQRFAVGDAFALSQGLDGGLVAGQLPVGLGDGGGDPHQRVEPVHREAHAPQQRPQRVQMAGVGGLMGQHMPQPLRRGDNGGGKINGGPEQPEQAGGGETCLHQIDGIPAVLRGIGRPRPPELLPEAQVGHQKPHRHGGDADQPEDRQQVRRRHHPLPDDRVRKGFLPAGGRGRLPGGGAASLYLRCGGCDLGRCPHGRGGQRHSVNFPLFQPFRHCPAHRLRR